MQVEDRAGAALHGAADALRLLVQLEVREQRLHLGSGARERSGDKLDGALLPEHEIDRAMHRPGRLGVVFLDLQHSRDVLLELGLRE